MEALDGDSQYGKQEALAIKRRPLPSNNNGQQFTLPRLKKIKRELLMDLPLEGHECQQEIFPMIRKSFHFGVSTMCLNFTRVQTVHNSELTAKYLDRRRDMKSNGYSDALVADTLAFLQVDSPSMADKICREGIRCGNQQFSGLGVAHMAVHLCKHADVLTPAKTKPGEKILVMVKLLKGKVKMVVCKNIGVQLEPTPNFDCHIAKPNIDQAVMLSPHNFFYSTQLYVYEYGDFSLEDFPRQILPYAVVYYTLKEPVMPVSKNIASSPHPSQNTLVAPHKGPMSSSSLSSPALSSMTTMSSPPADSGPSNEVWRGRLHIHLVEGGHIFIEVMMLSYFVPLTVSLISPIKIHSLYPESNAQFTFFCGLTGIAQKDEVEWRAHYFRSCIMRPRPNNEDHFRALIKHISSKREMPTVRLPQDVFLFLMPDCLLASQLGLVRREDESPVLHCVIMSKYSTSQAQQKHLRDKRIVLNNYGSSTSWENLFEDSESEEEDSPLPEDTRKHLRKSMSSMFRQQRHINNKFAAMSLADAEANFSPCACKKVSAAKIHQQMVRDGDVARIFQAMHSSLVQVQSSHSNNNSFHSPSSRPKAQHQVFNEPKSKPYLSSSASPDSEMDVDIKSYSSSLLTSNKTVEEELSEEELTNEQMEDIIFMRKPVSSTAISLPKSASKSSQHSSVSQKHGKHMQTKSPSVHTKSSHSANDLTKHHSKPLLSSTPKIIPTEPVQPAKTFPTILDAELGPKIIPTEPVQIEEAQPNSNSSISTVQCENNKSAISNEESPQMLIHHEDKKISTLSDDKIISVHSENAYISDLNDIKQTAIVIEDKNSIVLGNDKKPSVQLTDKTEVSVVVPKIPKSILKKSSVTIENHLQSFVPPPPLPPPPPPTQTDVQFSFKENDFGDVDMRVPYHNSANLHPVFLSAKLPPTMRPHTPTLLPPTPPPRPTTSPPQQTQEQQVLLSPSLFIGSWLAADDIQPLPASQSAEPVQSSFSTPTSASNNFLRLDSSLSPSSPHSPPSPASLATESPPSPTNSPASPLLDSPSSPPTSPPLADWESPASPTHTEFSEKLRSSPVAIPTSRVLSTVSPEVSFDYQERFVLPNTKNRNVTRERIDNVDDMKSFLNSGFDSDLDSSYEDDR